MKLFSNFTVAGAAMALALGAAGSAQAAEASVTKAAVPLMILADFESGTIAGWNIVRQNVPVIASSPTRAGKHSLEFSLDYYSSAQRERTEVRALKSDADMGKDYWYGFSIYLPTSHVPDKVWEIVAQWYPHPDSTAEAGRNPPLQLNTTGGRWGVANKWDAAAVTDKTNYGGSQAFDLGPYAVGQWTDWVFHVKWSYEDDGILQVWKNGELVVDRRGPNTYNDARGPFFKMGIYKGWEKAAPDKVSARTLFYDEFRMAGPDGSYAAVAPGGALLKPEPPQRLAIE